MKLTLNIEAESPDEMIQALGKLAFLSTPDPQPVATKATRQKAETNHNSTKATETLPTGSPAPSMATAAQEPAATSAVVTASTQATSATDVPVTEADIVAAANAAAGKLGAAGPAKIRDYIKANFKKADGTEGTLKTTAPSEQPRLLSDLQKIARGELTL